MRLSKKKVHAFQKEVWDFYKNGERVFAWRYVTDPYKVAISEVMLQQTQTSRVIEKFEQWLVAFPSFAFLAQASLCEVLRAWQGLGYNRRAKYLHEMSKIVMEKHNGVLPADPEVLVQFPGIGRATAASICAFAYNTPTVFIETNIRTVFLHHFFQKQDRVHDRDIMPLVAQTVSNERPREWYYALMDYGVLLKKTTKVSSRNSVHYSKQSKFEGSDRQIRGRIIRALTGIQRFYVTDLIEKIGDTPDRVHRIVADLCHEGLIVIEDGMVFIR